MTSTVGKRWAKRRRLARLVVAGATLVCTGLAVVGIKLTAVAFNDWMGITASETPNPHEASQWFARNLVFNYTEPWVALYNAGTAAYGELQWVAAEQYYRRALPLAPSSEKCRVMLNLAWTLEARGDALKAAGNVADARQAWDEARDALPQTVCPQPERKHQEQTSQRIGDKQAQTPRQQPNQADEPPSGSSDTPDQAKDRAEQLRRKQDKAATQATQARDAQQDANDETSRGSSNKIDRPW